MNTPHSPKISIIVVAYNMPRQFANTLSTLLPSYQQQVRSCDYEVIAIENASDNTLDSHFVEQLPDNFHYILRQESSCSPVFALNEGLQLARGEFIGLMIDGAHMLSPGILKYAMMASAINNNAFITVPVYHMGPDEQHISAASGYCEDDEIALLESINWRDDGYQLFDISSNCSANPRGYFVPIMESNCYFAPQHAYKEIGYIDTDFCYSGGGSINLHLTRQLGIRQYCQMFTLAGEGSFHQFHGGVTSGPNRDKVAESFQAQLDEKWLGDFQFLRRNPTILGAFPEPSQRFLKASSQRMMRRFHIAEKEGFAVWPDDDTSGFGSLHQEAH